MANTFMVQLENAFKTFSADMKLFSCRHKSAIHKKDKNANYYRLFLKTVISLSTDIKT